MPDTYQPDPERRSPAALRDPVRGTVHCVACGVHPTSCRCGALDRLVRPPAAPSGLPIFSTERLTAAEREQIRAFRRRLEIAVEGLAEVLACNRVDRALDGLQQVAAALDGHALRVAAGLGRNR